MECPECKSIHIVRRGYTVTKSKGKRIRYFCANCGTTFYTD